MLKLIIVSNFVIPLKENIPWMKRGEGYIPDNIYKEGSFFPK